MNEGMIENYAKQSQWDRYNPVNRINDKYAPNAQQSLRGILSLNWGIVKGLTYHTDLSLSQTWNQNKEWTGAIINNYLDDNTGEVLYAGNANLEKKNSWGLRWTNTLSYDFTLGKIHRLNILAGHEVSDSGGDGLKASGTYFPANFTKENAFAMINQYDSTKGVGDFSSSVSTPSRILSFFGRLNYNLMERYLLTVTFRADGSSKFAPSNRWGYFPAAALGWRMSEEAFLNDVDWLDNLKLRVSYGELANQNTTSWYPTYQTLGVTTNGGKWLQNGALTSVASVPGLISTSLSWEKIKNTNIGFDFGALNNRLTGSFDYFWRKTKNMVGPGVELPAILGATVPSTNNTDLTTFGWELSIGWRDKVGELGYGVKLNISDNQTRIDKYPNPTNSLSKYMAGELTGDIYGYTTIGIAKTQEEMDAHIASLPKGGQTAIGSKWEAGDIMYADINGDGKIDNGSNTLDDMGDLKKIGNNTPRFRTGITLDAQWKGFDFSMFWQGVLKRDFDPGENSMVFWGTTGSGQWWSTSFKDHMDYFRAEDTASPLGANVNAYYPRPLFNNKNHKTQTAYLQNAAYMRLKNLQLGYTLPKSLINKIGLQNVRVYVSGENLLTITGLSDTMDPETAGIGKQGGTVYPLSRVYSFGLSVNF